MKLLKPSWVNHDGQPIFSVDLHPDGSRFATGGQGGDAGRVVIWNMGPVRDEEQERKDKYPKLLCQMDNHTACVNVVRWSHSGRYLASAGDDRVIMIWQISSYSSSSSFLTNSVNIEQWRCVHILRGHSGDILDLNWSPQDDHIASSSIDTSVIVWNAKKFPEIVAHLNGHSGFVKGVSWDPINKYLASQSDDKSIKIWRTKDWQVEKSILDPFVECGATTHVLRLSWSPDGQFLVSAHAMNNSGSTAQIVEREGWKTQRDFVGHRKAVTCVRFCPLLFKEKQHYYSCIAIGSRDRSLSIWCTKNKRPSVVIHDLFEDSILDISWSKDGNSLMTCSWDGTVAFFSFEALELGQPANEEAKNAFLQKLYGKSLNSNSSAREKLLVEDPQILKAREEQQQKKQQQQQQQKEQQAAQKKQQSAISSPKQHSVNQLSIIHNGGGCSNESGSRSAGDSRGSNKLIKGPTDKQIETRMPDGRRRITPLYIPPPTDCDGAPIPFTVHSTTFSSSSEAKTKIIVEKRDESNGSSATSSQKPQGSPNSKLALSNSQNFNQISNNLQNSHSQSQSQTPQTSTNLPHNSNISNNNMVSVKQELDHSSPLQASTPNLSPQDKTGEKRPATTSGNSLMKKIKPSSSVKVLKNVEGKTINGSTPNIIPKKKDKEFTKKKISKASSSKTHIVETPSKTEEKQEKSTAKASDLRAQIVQFPPLKIEKTASININRGSLSEQGSLLAEVENGLNGTNLSCLRVFNNDNEKLWEVFISSKISGLTGCEYLIAIACDDCTISVFSTNTGRRLHPPLLINSLAAKLTCAKHFLMVITSKASIWLWDFEDQRFILKNESLIALFYSHGAGVSASEISLVNTSITASGAPLITLSTGKSFVFDVAFGSWSLISNTHDLLNYHSDYKLKIESDPSAYPLAIIQSQHRLMKSTHYLFQSNPSLQKSCTLSFIDQQLASSLLIGSPKEYRRWLLNLAQFLAEEGLESRLREICQYLLGPPYRGPESKWEGSILGNDKHELLKEILAITTCNLELQRFYTEFKQQLDLITSSSSIS